jgi:hypothetical protein
MVMPGLLGSEVVSRVRAARPGLPALFMTGYAEQALDSHGISALNLHVLQKPFTAPAGGSDRPGTLPPARTTGRSKRSWGKRALCVDGGPGRNPGDRRDPAFGGEVCGGIR